jgi:hypothetical protein
MSEFLTIFYFFIFKKSCLFLYVPISLSSNSNINASLLCQPRSQAIEAMEISKKLTQYYKFSSTPSVGQDNRPRTGEKLSYSTKLHALLSLCFFLFFTKSFGEKKQFFFFPKSFGERERE